MESPDESRPEGGIQKGVSLRVSAKIYASMRPNQNTGIETPIFAPIIVTTSVAVLRRTAEMSPNSTPKKVENNIAPIVTSSVIGSRSKTISITGRLLRMDSPKSP